jgi:hypothetical protein
MPSERKIAANRGNARKSTGPRSARGKAHTAQNALRHGASTAFLERSASSEVERMAMAIAGDSALTLEYEQALIIAESDFIIRKVRTARLAEMERMLLAMPPSDPNISEPPQRRESRPQGMVETRAKPQANIEAISLAIPRILKLDRCERRALSRRRRAARALRRIKAGF